MQPQLIILSIYLITLVLIQCMFCNMVSAFVLGPGPTGCN